jgi:ribonuclease P protein component
MRAASDTRPPLHVMSHVFPDARRIRRRSEFLRVYDRGTKVHGRFMTLFAYPNQLDYSRLGVSATRKIGGAVQRNRAKRRVRELFRMAGLPPGVDFVVVVRENLARAEWADLGAEFRALVERQRRLIARGARA